MWELINYTTGHLNCNAVSSSLFNASKKDVARNQWSMLWLDILFSSSFVVMSATTLLINSKKTFLNPSLIWAVPVLKRFKSAFLTAFCVACRNIVWFLAPYAVLKGSTGSLLHSSNVLRSRFSAKKATFVCDVGKDWEPLELRDWIVVIDSTCRFLYIFHFRRA